MQPDGKIVVAGTDRAAELRGLAAQPRRVARPQLRRRRDGRGRLRRHRQRLGGGIAAGREDRRRRLDVHSRIRERHGRRAVRLRRVARRHVRPRWSRRRRQEGLLATRSRVPATRSWCSRTAGSSLAGGLSDNFAITRLTSTGAPDGTQFEPVDFGGTEYVQAATFQADGKLVVAGASGSAMAVPGDGATAVARYAAGRIARQDARRNRQGDVRTNRRPGGAGAARRRRSSSPERPFRSTRRWSSRG